MKISPVFSPLRTNLFTDIDLIKKHKIPTMLIKPGVAFDPIVLSVSQDRDYPENKIVTKMEVKRIYFLDNRGSLLYIDRIPNSTGIMTIDSIGMVKAKPFSPTKKHGVDQLLLAVRVRSKDKLSIYVDALIDPSVGEIIGIEFSYTMRDRRNME